MRMPHCAYPRASTHINAPFRVKLVTHARAQVKTKHILNISYIGCTYCLNYTDKTVCDAAALITSP